jgi:hypothetical protein
VLPNTLAKFHVNLCNLDDHDTAKEEQKVIKTFWLELLCKTESTNQSCSFSGAMLTSRENLILKLIIPIAWTLEKGALTDPFS